jgi:hypothetical protein
MARRSWSRCPIRCARPNGDRFGLARCEGSPPSSRVKKSESQKGAKNPFYGKGPGAKALDIAAEKAGTKVFVYDTKVKILFSIGTSGWRGQHISCGSTCITRSPCLTSSTGFTLLSPVDSNFQASLGNVHLPTTVFIHCLIAAGCNTIRLKAYGQKMPMTEDFLHKLVLL